MSKGYALRGLTLIETLTCIAIIGITMTMAVPALTRFNERIRISRESAELHQAISLARSLAITQRSRITLCPLSTRYECTRDWNQQLTAFNDSNSNRRVDAGETIYSSVSGISHSGALRHFNSSVISFDERGFAGFHTGSLSLCHSNQGGNFSGSVFIISRNGRIRPGTDRNGDGLPETPNGKNIPCPST
ncbi:GspH/FimT family pseudopilin [Thalassolituus marinus]|uniref:Type II secretion system protein H n=1 Tax=Thalassolituus marinus TaxID=671053 RepID=A0ABS7ZNB5_9GAMM|nr:GspH/FimT family pseudopilin [Thalassolituus marinus]MCA6063187.1 GspH/FimT family pseudopilin [Thalassolituus marinus]